MKKCCTAKQIMRIDRIAQEKYGIPSIVLMENAGRKAFEIAIKMLPKRSRQGIVCVSGRGNNGGDGFVCARHLLNQGIGVSVFLIGSKGRLKNDPGINYSILEKMGQKIINIEQNNNLSLFKQKLRSSNLIIDAIFGIGIAGEIKEPHAGIINLINQAKKKILSLDVPSGLNATTGKVLGTCIKATKTITFALPKRGLFKDEGVKYSGEVIVGDISIPIKLIRERA